MISYYFLIDSAMSIQFCFSDNTFIMIYLTKIFIYLSTIASRTSLYLSDIIYGYEAIMPVIHYWAISAAFELNAAFLPMYSNWSRYTKAENLVELELTIFSNKFANSRMSFMLFVLKRICIFGANSLQIFDDFFYSESAGANGIKKN